MVDFCLKTSAEEVPSHDGSTVRVVTALAPLPHPRFPRFFAQIKQDLGFGIYVPDCDTTACSFSAATQAGSTNPILDQPLLDFYRGYQVREGANEPRVTVPLNDNIDHEGGVVTWIDNLAGERPYGNDLDDILRFKIIEHAIIIDPELPHCDTIRSQPFAPFRLDLGIVCQEQGDRIRNAPSLLPSEEGEVGNRIVGQPNRVLHRLDFTKRWMIKLYLEARPGACAGHQQ